MSVTDRILSALTTVIRMNDKVEADGDPTNG